MRLTDALTLPPAPVDEVSWRGAIDGIPRVLAGLAERAGGGRVRLTAHDVRVALEGGARRDTPFAWSLRTVQRALGLTAVEDLLFGSSRSPADAVRTVVAEATRRSAGGDQLDRWLSGLAPAGKAAVGAAAVTWATRLWTAVDWDALPTPLVIGRDHWWDSSQPPLLALRSRVEVRSPSAQLVVLTGARRDSARHELCLALLVEALRAADASPPPPIVGWWPDSGHIMRVDPQPGALDLGVAAVGAVLRARRQLAA